MLPTNCAAVTNSRKYTIWSSSSLLAFVPEPLGVSTVMMTGSWVLLDALGMANAYHGHWTPWLARQYVQEEMDVECWVDHPWAMLSSIMPTQWSFHNNPKDKPESTLGCGCWALGSAGGSEVTECIEEHRNAGYSSNRSEPVLWTKPLYGAGTLTPGGRHHKWIKLYDTQLVSAENRHVGKPQTCLVAEANYWEWGDYSRRKQGVSPLISNAKDVL